MAALFYKTFCKNSLTRGVCGWVKNSVGVPSSMILPLSIKIILEAISLAKFISCVTIIVVMPALATSRIRDNTSPIDSGSSAEVGSSNNKTLGLSIIERMMAIRCFWPPERLDGYEYALDDKSIWRSKECAFFSAASRSIIFNLVGAKMRLSMTVRLFIRLKC